jgi:inorganic pyrophosphatase
MDRHEVDVVVEIPRGRRNKYEMDEEKGVVRLNRRVFAPVAFPADYGYVDGSTGSDGDGLDALVLMNEEAYPGVWVRARVIGALRLRIGDAEEDKVITVAVSDPGYDGTRDLADLPPSVVAELEAFFEMYRTLENGPTPQVLRRLDAAQARDVVERGRQRVG